MSCKTKVYSSLSFNFPKKKKKHAQGSVWAPLSQKFRDPAPSLWLGLNLVLPVLSPKGFPFSARFRQDDSAWKPPFQGTGAQADPLPACLSWLFFPGRVLWHLGSSAGPEAPLASPSSPRQTATSSLADFPAYADALPAQRAKEETSPPNRMLGKCVCSLRLRKRSFSKEQS